MARLIALEALTLQVPVLDGEHVNRAPFTGILTRLDEPSTRPPSGSDGHRVLMRRDAAAAALPSLIAMGVNSTTDLRGHAKQTKIGVITDASIQGQDVVISGVLYEKDFPEEVAAIRAEKDQLGMSYELSNVDVEDPHAEIWVLRSFVFTGAAILYKDAAAYQQTAIAATAQEDSMSKEILEKITAINERLDSMKAEAAAAKEANASDETQAEKDEAAATETTATKDEKKMAAADTEAAATLKAMQTFLRAMGYRDEEEAAEEEAAEDQDAMMRHMMKTMFRSMAYPGGGFGGEHGDEAEDVALFKRLMRQGRMEGKAGKPVPGLAAMQRQIKELTAAMGLITDTLTKQNGLITDLAQNVGALSTDQSRGNNGGAVRKTMAAEGSEKFVGKFDGEVEAAKKEDGSLTAQLNELEAQLDREKITDPRQRIARKLELQWNNAGSKGLVTPGR